MSNAGIDQNSRQTLTALSNLGDGTIVQLWADPVTHRLLVDLPTSSGTVTSVSVTTANGFAGTVTNSTTTPAIKISITVTGILVGNGTTISAAVSGTDLKTVGGNTIIGSGDAGVIGAAYGGTGISNNASATVTSSGNFAYTRTLTNTTNVTFPTSGTLATIAGTETFTNKRITRRVSALSNNSGFPSINTDNFDVIHITLQTTTITSFTTNLSGTPNDGDTLRISLTGSAVAMTWGASFESSGNITLPTTLTNNVRLDVGLFWNTETSKWRNIGNS